MHAIRHSVAKERLQNWFQAEVPKKIYKIAVSNELGHNKDYATKVYLGK
jgi:hypothetical protein